MADQHLRADVELEMAQDWAGDPLPPVLEQAKLGDLGLFQEELRRRSHPLDFRAGPAVYSNRTPLHLATMHGHHEIVFLTASNESDDLHGIHGSHGGYTPLHFAAFKESPNIARLLLRQPCQVQFSHNPVNIRAATWRGHTPLDIVEQKLILKHLDGAQKKKIEELVELLEGSDENWLQQEQDRNTMLANAILVGAALVAAVAFRSWLQPLNSIFYLFVAFAFSFSVIALVIGTLATVPYTAASLIVEVQQLQRAVKLARRFLVATIYCFAYAGSLLLHKVETVNGKFSNARFEIIAWLPLLTYFYIAYYETSYKSRMDGVYGKKLAFSSIVLLLLGAGVGFVTLTIVNT